MSYGFKKPRRYRKDHMVAVLCLNWRICKDDGVEPKEQKTRSIKHPIPQPTPVISESTKTTVESRSTVASKSTVAKPKVTLQEISESMSSATLSSSYMETSAEEDRITKKGRTDPPSPFVLGPDGKI